MKTSKESEKRKSKWKDEYYLVAYEYAKAGMSDSGIAKLLGINVHSFLEWIRRKEALQKALEKGRKEKVREEEKNGKTHADFLFGQMEPKLKRMWDTLSSFQEKSSGSVLTDEARRFLEKEPKRIRQELWLHAFFHCNFNMTRACSMMGISTAVVFRWINEEAGFAELVQGVHQAKKDFFENALVEKVREGDTSAILFVNRTVNRDRGYNDKMDVDVSGTITHKHKIDELDIDLETKKKLLDATRRKRQAQLPNYTKYDDGVMDAEFEVKEKNYGK